MTYLACNVCNREIEPTDLIWTTQECGMIHQGCRGEIARLDVLAKMQRREGPSSYGWGLVAGGATLFVGLSLFAAWLVTVH